MTKTQPKIPPVQQLVFASLLLAVNILLPRVVHLFGQSVGAMISPMHFGTLIAGLFLGPVYGLAIGLLTPLIGFLLGSPDFARMVLMMPELASYGLVSGLMMLALRKVNNPWLKLYPSLVVAMIAGRLVYAGALLTFGESLGMPVPAPLAVFASFAKGIPGIIVQLAVVPLVVFGLWRLVRRKERTA